MFRAFRGKAIVVLGKYSLNDFINKYFNHMWLNVFCKGEGRIDSSGHAVVVYNTAHTLLWKRRPIKYRAL